MHVDRIKHFRCFTCAFTITGLCILLLLCLGRNVLSCSVLSELLCKVRDHIGCLHKLSECAAMLDMLHSFAHAATLSNYGQLL